MRGTIVLYVATSLDGFIATEDGGVSWLEPVQSDDAGRYVEFFAGVDCLLVGSHTYVQILTFGEWPYGQKPTYVTTHRDLPLATEHVELVAGDLRELANELREHHERIWLVGGAQLSRAFLRSNLVDEIWLSVVPLLLGGGVSLFGDSAGEHDLDRTDFRSNADGIVELRYCVAANDAG